MGSLFSKNHITQVMDLLHRSSRLFLAPFKEGLFWLINVEKILLDEIEKAQALLNADDLKGSMPLIFEQDRHRSALIYAIVKFYLGVLTHRPPQKLTLRRNALGKPYLHDYPLQFNISHTKRYALLGIHASKQIGVDIEELNDGLLEGTTSFLFPCEIQWLYDLFKDPGEGALALWCAKEALLKAVGLGFSANPLPRFIAIKSIGQESHLLTGMAPYLPEDTKVYVYHNVLSRHKIAISIL